MTTVANPEEEKKDLTKVEPPVQKLDKFFVKMDKKEAQAV
jgi:hypothetical protein